MIKVITYGTYDLLHYGHIRLLERAKALGDYLIVGVTADDFDKNRGKINVQQSLSERIAAVRDTGLADEIIVEEYEGQKIDDIRRLDVDIFTVGSDWVGYFDYLKEYCKVVYLERTQGISSSEIRNEKRAVSLGLVGEGSFINKVAIESSYVNGLKLSGVYAVDYTQIGDTLKRTSTYESYEKLVEISDAVYIRSNPILHYKQVKYALEKGKHVLCEAPIALKTEECRELFQLAKKNRCKCVDIPVYFYRVTEESLSRTISVNRVLKRIDFINLMCKKDVPSVLETALDFNIAQNVLRTIVAMGRSKKDYKEVSTSVRTLLNKNDIKKIISEVRNNNLSNGKFQNFAYIIILSFLKKHMYFIAFKIGVVYCKIKHKD